MQKAINFFKYPIMYHLILLFGCTFKVSVNYRMKLILYILLFAGIGISCSNINELQTYDFPGGLEYVSPDYSVTIEQGKKSYNSFVYFNYALDEYMKYYSWDRQIYDRQVKPAENRSMTQHSSSIFSFSGEVTIRVTVNENAKHITLPLTSARVLPSSYNIPCWIENGNTIVFKLNRPEKVAVIANYEEAWNVFEKRSEGHVPIRNYSEGHERGNVGSDFKGDNMLNYLSEGYKNPIFIFALPPEESIPDKNAAQTLVVKPGDSLSQELIDQYKTIWFTPGFHDLSKMGSHPYYQTMIRGGQTFYLEGGSYLAARIKKDKNNENESVSIRGRGTISGIKHEWFVGYLEDGSIEPTPEAMEKSIFTSYHDGSQLIDIDTISGITVTELAFFGITGGHFIEDVSLTGTWHGNNDGVDYTDDCLIENCFFVAHDDNLKLNSNTHARHVVLWQMENAHPIMLKEVRNNVVYSNTIIEDIDIITYGVPKRWGSRWSAVTHSAIGMTTAGDITVNNFTFRDIRIESPYLFRVFSIYNMDSGLPYAPIWFQEPTSDSVHTRINEITFENISVNSPVILHRSLIGSAYDNSLSDIRFINLNINGTVVNEENKDEFVEIEYEKVKGLSFIEK